MIVVVKSVQIRDNAHYLCSVKISLRKYKAELPSSQVYEYQSWARSRAGSGVRLHFLYPVPDLNFW